MGVDAGSRAGGLLPRVAKVAQRSALQVPPCCPDRGQRPPLARVALPASLLRRLLGMVALLLQHDLSGSGGALVRGGCLAQLARPPSVEGSFTG